MKPGQLALAVICGIAAIVALVVINPGRKPSKASSSTTAIAGSKASDVYEIADDNVTLWDTRESMTESSKVAGRRDEAAFRRLFLAHGIKIERGAAVRVVTKGGLAAEVEELGPQRRHGWTERENVRTR